MTTYLPDWIAVIIYTEVYRLKNYLEQIRLLNFAVLPDTR